MILSLEITNFRSFKEKTLFSFEAIKKYRSDPEDRIVVTMEDGTRINKLSIVYGANASGKSNLVKAFSFIDDFWNNFPQNETESLPAPYVPFLLDETSKNAPTEFILTFYIDSLKYVYTLAIQAGKVITEKLESVLKKQENIVFLRTNNQLSFLKGYNENDVFLKELEIKCLPNMSLFAAYQQLNKANTNIKEIIDVISWNKINWMRNITVKTNGLSGYTKNLILKNNDIKDKTLEYIIRADFNIDDVSIRQHEVNIPEEFLSGLPDEIVKTIKLNEAVFTHVVYDSAGKHYYTLGEDLQSEGTKRLFGLSGVMTNLINNDAFITIDEVETSLHPKLVKFLIRDFFDNSDKSQLLLTTHYDGFLEISSLIRKDSVWFTHKKNDASTDLYSIVDFKGYRKIKSLLKAYQSGLFGAVPNIAEEL